MSFILTFIIEGCSISHFPGGKFLCGHLMEFFNLIYFNFLMLELLPFESLNVKFSHSFFHRISQHFCSLFLKWGGGVVSLSSLAFRNQSRHPHTNTCVCANAYYLFILDYTRLVASRFIF